MTRNEARSRERDIKFLRNCAHYSYSLVRELKESGNWTKAHLKSEIKKSQIEHALAWTYHDARTTIQALQFRLEFLIFGFEVGFCPISRFPHCMDYASILM